MPAEEIIRYVLSFLGGGVISAGGNWAYTSWSARRAREWQSRYLGADYALTGSYFPKFVGWDRVEEPPEVYRRGRDDHR